MCKNVKQNVLFERSEFTFCSFCMCKYSMFFLVTRHSQVNLPLLSLLEKIPTGNQVGRWSAETKKQWFGPFDKLRDRMEVEALWFWSTDARPCVPTLFASLMKLLPLGIINTGHFDRLSDRIASTLTYSQLWTYVFFSNFATLFCITKEWLAKTMQIRWKGWLYFL